MVILHFLGWCNGGRSRPRSTNLGCATAATPVTTAGATVAGSRRRARVVTTEGCARVGTLEGRALEGIGFRKKGRVGRDDGRLGFGPGLDGRATAIHCHGGGE